MNNINPLIAISAEDNIFQNNRLLDKSLVEQYPGASWYPLLKDKLKNHCDVVTVDVALKQVEEGCLGAKVILVIQHGSDSMAEKLIELGATPLILTCFESPLYMGEFYKNIKNIAPKYKHRILFSGLHDLYDACFGINYDNYFPSYFLNETNETNETNGVWNDKEFMTAVIGNKYVVSSYLTNIFTFSGFLWVARNLVSKIISGTLNRKVYPINKIQLQDKRLEITAFFLRKKLLKLYGKGWGSLNNLPPKWKKVIQPLISKNSTQPCKNKKTVIKKYKFCLCIENAQFPGYVTEKIIDCLIAKVIPVYLGAPDIEKYIPKYCYIKIENKQDMTNLLNQLQNIDVVEANKMLEAGQKFINSKRGRKYSYEGYSEFVSNIILNELDCYS